MFGVSTIKVIKETQTIPISELLEDDGSLFEGTIFDIDDEIAQPYSDRDSFDHDSNPINERVSLAIEDVEAVDFGTNDQPKELKIGSLLSTYKSDRLIHLLRSYLDVFAWSYEDMPSLDPSIVKEEIQKQLSVGFILVVEYLEWLANVIPIPKKDGKVRVCVDFEDLNKSSPKDDFPLPHIDLLVNSTASHSMLSFMNGFLRYNQILMAQKDMEKTTFITEWGTYCYRVMPFGLKNIRATYQRAATTLFHNMLHRNVEVYVDDMIVKSQGQADHLAALERFFERIQKFRLRLNPNNGTFGVTSRKLLGHMVSERGIEVDPDKIKAILDMLVSRIEKDIRGFLRRLQYISRFIARLTNISYQSGYGIGVLLVSPQGDHISRKISPKSSNGHEFILVAIDYFTKWVEFASYARLTSARVASFIRSHSIFHYRVPHELISDRGVHFRAEIDTLLQRYNI
ncbi:hypothetical protein VitviT2T_028685 [Vitis vinifera]|uniref:Integrase catalytic domain-containing protein n=1 Tax=Vitis vinifera TaxID=29760 RepID=A0ABY9DXE8_VITVI|nr:hypothetical protein VitviT2T_028685 [Vitis vinifera]